MFYYLKTIVSIIPTNITSDRENKTGKFFIGPSLQKSVSLYLENLPSIYAILHEFFLFFIFTL